PTGENIVIDLGVGDTSEGSDTQSPLALLQARGVTQLDKVIITHPHKDHLDDIFSFDSMSPRVLQRPAHLTPDEVRQGNRGKDQAYDEKYLSICARYNEPLAQGEDPADATNSGMTIGSFTPVSCSRDKLNDHSIVTFLQYAHSTICLPGDNERASWLELLRDDDFQHWLALTNVFVASHHGRESGYCEEVFQFCKPDLVIVSDGPATETSAVAKYFQRARGWEVHSRSGQPSESRRVLTTRSDGTIRVRAVLGTDGFHYREVSTE